LGKGLEWRNGFKAPRSDVQQERRGDTEGVERVEIWEGDFPLSNRLGVLESVVSSPSAVQG